MADIAGEPPPGDPLGDMIPALAAAPADFVRDAIRGM
jgi:hypothetical protein